jgi:cytochrome c-type biogenesis protein CcsB
VIEYKHGIKIIGAFVMVIESLAMLSAALLPYRFKSIEPLNPALQSKWHWMIDLLSTVGLEKYAIGWLDFHVFTTFIGYAAFAISFGLSIMYLIKNRAEEKGSANQIIGALPDAATLDELGYRAIAWGFPFLAVGIVTGAVWANYAWGTYWSWDPKETWSLITWFVYAAYLHARVTRGWRGKRCAYLSLLGFLGVIFLYWGVSFILPGLHAYA